MPLNIQLAWVKTFFKIAIVRVLLIFLGIMLSFQLLFPSLNHFCFFPPWSYLRKFDLSARTVSLKWT